MRRTVEIDGDVPVPGANVSYERLEPLKAWCERRACSRSTAYKYHNRGVITLVRVFGKAYVHEPPELISNAIAAAKARRAPGA